MRPFASIFLTKASHQADALQHPLEAIGFDVINLPCFEIQAVARNYSLEKMLQVNKGRWLFTSPNAVMFAKALGFDFENKAFAAIGMATQNALLEHNVNASKILVAPKPYTSEAFISCLDNAFTGQAWGLITGDKGRGVLQSKLHARGISVESFIVYQLQSCEIDLLKVMRCAKLDFDTPLRRKFCIITSEQAFIALQHEALKQRLDLNQFEFITSSDRLLNILKNHGILRVNLTKSALNSDIIEYMKGLFD